MTKVRELTFRGEDKPVLYACGECGSVHSPKIYACREEMAHESARRAAEECCAPRHCACGVRLEGGWTACAPCRERNKLRRAKVVAAADYDGAVYAEGVTGEWGEGYSSDLTELLVSCKDFDDPVPAYCHPCHETHLRLDADSILEHALDGMHEDAADQVEDYAGLRQFIADWNEKQHAVSYHPDMSRVIVIDQERFDALISDPAVAP